MTPQAPDALADWDARAYHRVADPQFAWGLAMLDRVRPVGHELVLDAGCGTARLTAEIARRLPRGRLVAVDRSAAMLARAREHLTATLTDDGTRVALVRADLARLPFSGVFDLIVSTATFHWVLDHPALFRSLLAALRRGGRLVAQCGGGPNLARLHDRAERLMAEAAFAPYYAGWADPWQFAGADATAGRLRAAGFEAVETEVVPAPVAFADRRSFTEFVRTVICRPHLARLPGAALREQFIGLLADLAGADDPPFSLDYWRLNLEARRPARQDARTRAGGTGRARGGMG